MLKRLIAIHPVVSAVSCYMADNFYMYALQMTPMARLYTKLDDQ